MTVTITTEARPEPEPSLPPLRHGEKLTQAEFHRRYEAMPAGIHAELVGGVVYLMPSPVRRVHSKPHSECTNWLMVFKKATPGVEVLTETTLILGSAREPQPDLCLRILEPFGGRSRETEDGYIEGPPELAIEIGASTVLFDLVAKKRDYQEAGVSEYIVIVPQERMAAWFVLENGRYEELQPDEDGILRSRCFPGLWLDLQALLEGDSSAVDAVVARGLASPEYQEWRRRMGA